MELFYLLNYRFGTGIHFFFQQNLWISLKSASRISSIDFQMMRNILKCHIITKTFIQIEVIFVLLKFFRHFFTVSRWIYANFWRELSIKWVLIPRLWLASHAKSRTDLVWFGILFRTITKMIKLCVGLVFAAICIFVSCHGFLSDEVKQFHFTKIENGSDEFNFE